MAVKLPTMQHAHQTSSCLAFLAVYYWQQWHLINITFLQIYMHSHCQKLYNIWIRRVQKPNFSISAFNQADYGYIHKTRLNAQLHFIFFLLRSAFFVTVQMRLAQVWTVYGLEVTHMHRRRRDVTLSTLLTEVNLDPGPASSSSDEYDMTGQTEFALQNIR